MSETHSLYDFDPDAQPEDDRTILVCDVSDDYDVYGGRGPHGRMMGETVPPKRGWLGNPHRLTNNTREEAIEKFESDFYRHLRENRRFCNAVRGLSGRRVACHCRSRTEDEPACHLDVVKEALSSGRVHAIAQDHGIPLSDLEAELADGVDT